MTAVCKINCIKVSRSARNVNTKRGGRRCRPDPDIPRAHRRTAAEAGGKNQVADIELVGTAIRQLLQILADQDVVGAGRNADARRRVIADDDVIAAVRHVVPGLIAQRRVVHAGGIGCKRIIAQRGVVCAGGIETYG